MPNLGKGVVSTQLKTGGACYTVCLSGVLARGAEQFEPIVSALPGHVTAYHTTGKQFHVDDLIETVVADLERPVGWGFPINFVGASMGGMQVPFIVERLRQKHPEIHPDRLTAVLVDPPCGLESLSDGNAKFLAMPVLGPTISGALSLLGLKVPVGDDMLPQMDEITSAQPYKLADSPGYSTEDEAKKRVIETARKSLSGHYLALLFRHTAWMAKVGKDGSLARAVKSLEDVDTQYIACLMGNSPIKSDVSIDWWTSQLPKLNETGNLRRLNVTHCGFLQHPDEFIQALHQVPWSRTH